MPLPQPMNYEQLKYARLLYDDMSHQGFLINVRRAFNDKRINREQLDELIAVRSAEEILPWAVKGFTYKF